MAEISAQGRTLQLSYSTNVHPAESVAELQAMLRAQVAPVSRGAFGNLEAAVNLRLGMRQADELLGFDPAAPPPALATAQLGAPPAPACEELLATLRDEKLRVVSVNGFPIQDFHAPRVKEQVYAPSWTDPRRALYSLKIAKVLAHLLGERTAAAVSVPSGVFKGVADDAETKARCAHVLLACARELARLEELTGKTIVLGLEPEPYTTGESLEEFVAYFNEFILRHARLRLAHDMGCSENQAEDLARRFVTVNLDLCHQAVEFEDPLEDLKRLRAEGIVLSGLHVSAALKLREPAEHPAAFRALLDLDEPRYLHQVVAKRKDGGLQRFSDLPELRDLDRQRARSLSWLDLDELRCHFHVPLFAAFEGALSSTRDSVGPAARFAAREGLTDNFVVETYTWGVLKGLAERGNEAAARIVGDGDVKAGLIEELKWALGELQKYEV
ncbi:MAG: metabolite traffic protein EboE [Planctomycetota bacterium]|nr:metabolite traffic protein EboE [Planctomycetota bacterium]